MNPNGIILFTRNLTMDNSLMSTQSKGLGNNGSIWIQATESMNFTGDEEDIFEKLTIYSGLRLTSKPKVNNNYFLMN